jgi:hypothetical protein
MFLSPQEDLELQEEQAIMVPGTSTAVVVGVGNATAESAFTAQAKAATRPC